MMMMRKIPSSLTISENRKKSLKRNPKKISLKKVILNSISKEVIGSVLILSVITSTFLKEKSVINVV